MIAEPDGAILIGLVTLLGAGLTLFSGFGLGTLLTPVFALFFPIDLAIAMTAVVHFSNNLFKLWFYYRYINWKVVMKFGIPSIVAAFAGAYLLSQLAGMKPLFVYELNSHHIMVTPVKFIIAALLIVFSLMELIPRWSSMSFGERYLPLGGLLSGFFGGLSGNQGALRAAFLVRLNLAKEFFIGTGVVIACLIDITRLTVYSKHMTQVMQKENIFILTIAVVSAFIGVYFGSRLVKKVTIKTLQKIVAAMLLVFALLLGAGII